MVKMTLDHFSQVTDWVSIINIEEFVSTLGAENIWFHFYNLLVTWTFTPSTRRSHLVFGCKHSAAFRVSGSGCLVLLGIITNRYSVS